jgi:hypothetical protein
MRDPLQFQCCFCGEMIRSPDAPRQLTLQLEDSGEQSFYAHEKCLRRALHHSVPLAI